MSSFSDTLEEALRRAFPVQDPEALKRSVRILEEGYDPIRRLEGDVAQLKSDVRLIAERMEQGFARMDERFEAMERLNVARFDAVDKRFEAVDQRFLSMESANAVRFEQVDRRFAQQKRMMFAGFTVLAVLMFIYEFVA